MNEREFKEKMTDLLQVLEEINGPCPDSDRQYMNILRWVREAVDMRMDNCTHRLIYQIEVND